METTMTKKETTARIKAIAREVSNIKSDYSGVFPEDMPEEITEEIATLMTEAKELRAELED